MLGALVVFPVLAVGVAASASAGVRAALLGVPTRLLVALNIGRALGFFFLLVALDGRFGGPFPISAGTGDFITGGGALVLSVFYARGRRLGAATWGWTLFGLLDLVVTVTLAALSFNGSATQVISAGAGADALQHLSWSLIPSLLVPFYIVSHAIIFAQLWLANTQSVPAKGLADSGN